jgi:hypothetical protein
MRWIDFDQKKPTDSFPDWTPWTPADWQAWLDESARLHEAVRVLNAKAEQLRAQGDMMGKLTIMAKRNKEIDDNRTHWGKLKAWLLALSHGKCWFSETRDTYSHYDVEHFRPKKETKDDQNLGVDGKPTIRDGYWWLAFEYSNYRICGNVGNRKKGGWFPLHVDSHCSTYSARCEESETVYLIDPIQRADTRLLAFDEEGNAIPSPGCDDWEKKRVEVSINRLKLNDHDALPEERRKVWQRMTRAIDGFLQAKAVFRPGINPAPKVRMEENLRTIKELTRDDAELSTVALWCVRFRNEPQLLSLVGG